MPECDSCGANVDDRERECPYCGHSFLKHSTAARPESQDPQVFRIEESSVGHTIHFGDGVMGARPESGREVGHYRPETGHDPMGSKVCPKCGHKNPIARGECEACATPLRKAKPRFRR